MPENQKPSIFQLFQRHEKVTLTDKEADLSVEVILWKPSAEQARQGQLHLMDRVTYWESEAEITKRVEAMIDALPDDKDLLIERILAETVATKMAENEDLIDSRIKDELERERVQGLTVEDLAPYDPRPGIEIHLHKQRTEMGADFKREDLLKLVAKKDDLIAYLDSLALPQIEAIYQDQEREAYAGADAKTLKEALQQVSRKSTAMNMAMQDWTYRMLSQLTREPHENDPSRKGPVVFSEEEEAENYVGNAAVEVLGKLSEGLNRLMAAGRLDQVREAAREANFTPTAELQNDSTSPLPEAEAIPTSPPIPSTSSAS